MQQHERKNLRVLRIDPGYAPEPELLDVGKSSLKALQNAVGGLIQVVYPFPDEICIICNEEGKLEHLPANRALYDEDGNIIDIICGTFLLAGLSNDGDFQDLPKEMEEKYLKYYALPEVFFRTAKGEIIVRKVSPRARKNAEIWQLKEEAPAVLLYESFRHLANYGLCFNPDNYRLVYAFDHAEGCSKEALEKIFVRFNADRPDDFKGHSLSVSDVVVIDGRAFYVDTVGFREVAWKKKAA